MENFIIIAVLVVIIALAAAYLYKSKKSGKKCIGCPYCNTCSAKHKSNCGGTDNKK